MTALASIETSSITACYTTMRNSACLAPSLCVAPCSDLRILRRQCGQLGVPLRDCAREELNPVSGSATTTETVATLQGTSVYWNMSESNSLERQRGAT